jgi:D-alanine-D-alanine ligase
MTTRLRVALLFGGRSAEHDVSVLSAGNVFRALDPEHYEVIPIAITRDGTWLLCAGDDGGFPAAVPASGHRVVLLPGGSGRMLVIDEEDELAAPRWSSVDVLFPVLHGPFGEDGTVQGAAELAGVPYVGSDVLSSAVAMDKDAAKRLLREAGLPIARFRAFTAGEQPLFDSIVEELGRPVFVKPARLGSSVGVGKAASAAEFDAAVKEAFRHDQKILVEEYVPGREIECGVLESGDGSVLVSVPGEIVPTNRHSFYTYEAKYLDAEGAELKVPADLPVEIAERLRKLSLRAFRVLGCAGLARIDFFLCQDGKILVNELNTLPGCTSVSMYPRVLAASGVPYPDLVRRLIDHALRRAGKIQGSNCQGSDSQGSDRAAAS